MKLKLEKGYEFGDVLLDGTVDAIQQSSGETDNYATTLMEQVGQGHKKVRVICQGDAVAKEYEEVPGYTEAIQVVKCGEGKEGSATDVVKKAISAVKDGEGDLVVCHVSLKEKGDAAEKVGRVSKMVGRIWKKVAAYGMLFLICAGGPGDNAFVAMAMKKVKEEEATANL